MKKLISLFLLMFTMIVLAPVIASADLPPIPPGPNEHSVSECVKIVNINEFSPIVLVNYSHGVMAGNVSEIKNGECILQTGYKFNTTSIYKITKEKFDLINLASLNDDLYYKRINTLSSDFSLLFENLEIQTIAGYIVNSNPLIKKTIEYSITGNTSTGILSLYKLKEISEYNNGTPSTTETFSNPNSTIVPVSYNFGTVTLRNGSRGEAVKQLQMFLNQVLNLGLVIDGKLGPKTIAVIKQWQKDHDLTPDGLVGKYTKAKMNQSIQ